MAHSFIPAYFKELYTGKDPRTKHTMHIRLREAFNNIKIEGKL